MSGETNAEYSKKGCLQMIVIETGKQLNLVNVLSLRKEITQAQMKDELGKIGQFLQANSIKQAGPIVTTTYAIEANGAYDMEVLIPMDKPVDPSPKYRLKPLFRLVNALYVRHEGDPLQLHNVYEKMIEYIKDNGLQQLTTGYNVTIANMSAGASADQLMTDVYIGVSDNVL